LIEKEYVEFKGHQYFVRVATVNPTDDVINDVKDPATTMPTEYDDGSSYADIQTHLSPNG